MQKQLLLKMLCLLLSVNTYSLCLYVLMLLSLSQMAEQIVYYPNCRDRCSYLWCIRCRKHKSVLSVTSNTLLTGAREGIQTTYTSFRAFFFISQKPHQRSFSQQHRHWLGVYLHHQHRDPTVCITAAKSGRKGGGRGWPRQAPGSGSFLPGPLIPDLATAAPPTP